MTKPSLHDQLVGLLPRLRRFAMVLARNSDAADDLVQASVECALTRADQWEDGTRLDRWMFQITRTVWLNGPRAATLRQTEPIEDHQDRISGIDGPRSMEAKLTMDEVRGRFAKLPHDQQQALLLVCVEGYTYAEAGALLGVPLGTVVSRLARGRATLMDAEQVAAASNVAYLRRKEG